MAPKLPVRIPCRCARCSQAQGGFIHQTKQLVAKHAKAYPRPLTPQARPLLPSTQQNQPHLNQHHSENQYDESLPPVDVNDGLGDFGHGADDFGQDLLQFEALGPSQPLSRAPSPARFSQQIDEVFTSVEPPLIPDPATIFTDLFLGYYNSVHKTQISRFSFHLQSHPHYPT
jgi:hypothetical protein